MKSEKSVETSVETRSEQIKYAEIVYRSIDAELRDYQKILQRLSSTLSPYSNNLPEPVAKYIVAQIRDDLERWRRTYGGKGKPDQPRDELGQWTSADASNSPGKGEMNIDGAIAILNARADDGPPGKKLCATYVKEAIEKGGGITLVKHPRYAYQYDGYLDKYFEKLSTPEPDYPPEKGDIAVFQPPDDKHPDGHIQIYNGTQWVSDFKQPNGFWPSPAYRDKKPRYSIYRPKNWKPKPPKA